MLQYYHKVSSLQNIHLLSHRFSGSGLQARLSCIFCFRVSQGRKQRCRPGLEFHLSVTGEGSSSKLTWLLTTCRAAGLSYLLSGRDCSQFLAMWVLQHGCLFDQSQQGIVFQQEEYLILCNRIREWHPFTFAIIYGFRASPESCPHSRRGGNTGHEF